MTDLSQVTWMIARTGGFMAYGLLTASMVVGLVLGLGWRTRRWTRFVTTETHRFITLVGLVFIGIHGVTLALDPFIRFTPLELLVPALSHYRPLWVALGIVGGYLALAIWASEYARSRIGYRWWRRFHVLAFVAWALATVHGIATGTDTRSWWALAVYGMSVALVLGLIALRLRPRAPVRLADLVDRPVALARPAAGALVALAVVTAAGWAWTGPLRPGWNAVANNGHSSGGVARSGSGGTQQTRQPLPLTASAFQSDLSGSVEVSADRSSLLIDATIDSGPGGRFQLLVPTQAGDTPQGSLRLRTAAGATCVGSVTDVGRGQVRATCTDEAGGIWSVAIRLGLTDEQVVIGRIAGSPSSDAPA